MDEQQLKGLAGLLVLLGLYFLPTFIAILRHHHNVAPIALVNLFLGWTLIGWFASLIWAFTSPPPSSPIIIQQDFSGRIERPDWEQTQSPRRPPIILPQAKLPDHLFDKKRDE